MAHLFWWAPKLDDVRSLEASGLITVRSLDDLIVCNYTDKCTFERAWDDKTMACRGLILRLDRPWPDATVAVEIVALPFKKFFNLGEGDRWPKSSLISVTEKLDGSLGILYRYKDEYRIATRGSFDGKQALWATEFLRRYDLRDLPEDVTLLFEIVYPDNRIVVDYGAREDLVLLGVRSRYMGDDYQPADVAKYAQRFGFHLPTVHSDIVSIDDALERAKTLDGGAEGWVLRFQDGTRFKVKGARYLEIARLIAHLSRKHVIEAMAGGSLDSWLTLLPEEFHADVLAWRDEAELFIDNSIDRLNGLFAMAPTGSRKDFALWVNQYHSDDAQLLFAMLDNKDVMPLLYKQLLVRSAG